MNSTLVLRYNKKKGTVQKESGGKQIIRLTERMEIPLSFDDFLIRGRVGFDALHDKLALLAHAHQFELKPIVELIATTSIIRKIYLTRDCGLPQFVTIQILKLLRESGACVGIGSLRKTESYVMFLRNIVHHQERTLPSITSGKHDKQQYVLPDTVDDMSVEMLGEELRVAEEVGAKEAVLTKLRKKFHAKQKENREDIHKQRTIKKGGKKLSEVEQLLADSKVQEVLEAEYDDMPQKKRRRK